MVSRVHARRVGEAVWLGGEAAAAVGAGCLSDLLNPDLAAGVAPCQSCVCANGGCHPQRVSDGIESRLAGPRAQG